MFSDKEFREYVGYRMAEDAFYRYTRSIRRYIRDNRDLLEISGWIDYAYELARQKFVPKRPLPPEWSQEKLAALNDEYIRRYPKRVKGKA